MGLRGRRRARDFAQVIRGEIREVDFEPARGAEASKRRPAVIVSNDGANATASRLERSVITVVPVTSIVTRVYQVFLPAFGMRIALRLQGAGRAGSFGDDRAGRPTHRAAPLTAHVGARGRPTASSRSLTEANQRGRCSFSHGIVLKRGRNRVFHRAFALMQGLGMAFTGTKPGARTRAVSAIVKSATGATAHGATSKSHGGWCRHENGKAKRYREKFAAVRHVSISLTK